MLLRKFSLIAGYWHYWLNTVNEHSLHAPFVYNFYTHVIRADQTLPHFLPIETLRHQLLRSNLVLEGQDLGAGALTNPGFKRKIKEIANHSLTPPKYSRLLYRIAKKMEAVNIVELGTSLGINTLYLSSAVPEGQVYTLEGCPAIASEARRNFENWHLKNIHMETGNIDHTLPQLLRHISSLDLLYMDANHRYEPTLRYYEQCKAMASERSVFILDDIYWSKEMRKAWEEIRQDQAVGLSLDLFGAGIIFFKKLRKKQHYALIF